MTGISTSRVRRDVVGDCEWVWDEFRKPGASRNWKSGVKQNKRRPVIVHSGRRHCRTGRLTRRGSPHQRMRQDIGHVTAMGFTLDISRLTRPSEHEVIDLPVFWSTSYPARLLTRHPDLAQPKLLYPYQRLHTARHYRLHSPYNDNRSHLQTAYNHRMSRLCKKVRQYLPALDSVHMAVCLMHSMRFKVKKDEKA